MVKEFNRPFQGGNSGGGRFNNDRNSNSNNKGPKSNHQIKADPVRVIDQNGEMIGVISVREAISKAQDVGLDLVEVSPNAAPPVCKIMDMGKYLYEEQKKKKEAKKHQKVVHLKEVKLRVTTDPHDLEYRLKQCRGWFEEGDKVKFSLKFRGREMAHQELAYAKFKTIIEQLADVAKVDSHPRMEGGQLSMILSPVTSK